MKKTAIACFALAAAVFPAVSGEKPVELNMISGGKFQPVVMNGEVTGLRDWGYIDYNRIYYNRNPKLKTDGEPDGRECFALSCKDGVFTIEFKEKAPAWYYDKKRIFDLSPDFRLMTALIPARRYHATGLVKLNKGSVQCLGKKIGPAEGWQKLDFRTPASSCRVSITTEPGLVWSMKDLKLTPEYDKIGGEIALPDGGKLRRLVLPKNVPFPVKCSVFCWRGWLWQLTGTALPVYERETVKPEPGSLVFMPGKIPNGGYDFTLNRNGGTLVYGNQFMVNAALINYLRKFGYIVYNRVCRTKVPVTDPARILPAADDRCRPKFTIHAGYAYGSPVYRNGIVNTSDTEMENGSWYDSADSNICGHISNKIMPPPSEREKHPECRMMYRNGKRQDIKKGLGAMVVSPCLTDPWSRKYLLDRIVELAKQGKENKNMLNYCLGDNPDNFCHCPLCTKANADKTGKSYASVFFDFVNEANFRLMRECPGTSLNYCAYHTYTLPPEGKKAAPNMRVDFCLIGSEKPCNVHLNCSMNVAGPWQKKLSDWKKLVGKNNIRITTYDSHNPFMLIDILEHLSQYGSRMLMQYCHTMVENYTASRWNMGDDPSKIVAEYYDGICGKDAGKYVTAAQRLVYEYDKKYRHKTGEFMGEPGRRMRYMENLDRKTFDAVYKLLDQAEKTIAARKGDIAPVWWEKLYFMVVDLRKFPRSSCYTDAELKTFALRLAEFVRICDKLSKDKRYPYYSANGSFSDWSIPARRFMLEYGGLVISTTKRYWTDEPEVRKFMENPVKALIAEPEKTPGHWRFTNMILRGGENGKVLRRQSSGKGRIIASLKLDRDIRGAVLMTVAGWDDEKPGKSTFRITVNGREIFSGPNAFPEAYSLDRTPSGWMYFTIPAGLLKKGENLIELVNTVPDDPKRAIRQLLNPSKPEDGYGLKQDYFWGWTAIDEIRLTAPDDEFLKYADGEKGTAWHIFMDFKPLGKIENGGGKVSIRSNGARATGIITGINGNRWLVPGGVKFKLRLTVSGKGKINAGFLGYPADRRGVRTKQKMEYATPGFKLSGKPQTFEMVLTHKTQGFLSPFITVPPESESEITEFSLTPVKDPVWKVISWLNKPQGTVTEKYGTFRLVSKGAPLTGLYYGKKLATGPNAPVSITITASGKGRLMVGFWSYNKDGKIIYPGSDMKTLDLTAEKKEYKLNLKTWTQTETIIPVVFLSKTGGEAEISYYSLTVNGKVQ